MNIFGLTVKRYLLDNNLTQKDITDKLKLSKNTVNNWLNRDNVSLDKMLQTAEALNCDLKITLEPRGQTSPVTNSQQKRC